MGEVAKELSGTIRNVPDWPVKGVLFKDLTTLWRDPNAYKNAVDTLFAACQGKKADLVAAIEARGFIFAAPLAYRLGAGFVPIRKAGKLPWESISAEYSLEYGTNVLEMHKDAVKPGQRVLVVDDLLATGGSARAAAELIERLGGKVVGFLFLVELDFLNGKEKLKGYDIWSLIHYGAGE